MKKSFHLVFVILLLITSSLFLFSGCKNTDKNIQTQDLIIGDWVSDYFTDNWNTKILIFSFREETCSYLYPSGSFSKYQILADTLIINERTRKRNNKIVGGKKKFKFQILEINEYELSLKPLTKETVDLFKYFENLSPDTITLKRVKAKNKAKIKRIGFFSTGCYGPCPSMYLEIDSLGHILFNGRGYTEKEGYFSGSIPSTEMQYLTNKIHNIELDSLKIKYTTSWTDDQTCGVKLQLDNGQEIESSAYGFYKEPVELRILFHDLMETYKVAELERDTLLFKKFIFRDFEHRGYPPPPPPPLIEKK